MKRKLYRKTSRFNTLDYFKKSLKLNYEHFENETLDEANYKYKYLSFPDLPCVYSHYKKGSKGNLRKNASVAVEIMLKEYHKKNKVIPSYDKSRDYFTLVKKRMKKLEQAAVI